MSLAVVILAAGKGTRMKSALPKVLHTLAGKPMLAHVVEAAREVGAERIAVVYGHGGEQVPAALPGDDLQWALQAEQLGTGHAVAQAMPLLKEDVVLILYGDVPLISADTLKNFVGAVNEKTVALMTLTMSDPSGYGRILRDAAGNVTRIVEQKDASDEEKTVNEINTGILACPRSFLDKVLPALSSNNAQGEYYLTDVIAMAVNEGLAVDARQPQFAWEVDGVNDRVQLSRLERIYQGVQAEALMRAGVAMADPGRFDVRGIVTAGSDCFVDINAVFEGNVRLGNNVRIGPNCVIRDSQIGDDVVIEANSHIDGATIANACQIGPYARLRPGTSLADKAKIGNFVETKKATIGFGSKVNHLSYIGDAELGANVNVGAGTITCNYDGVNKFKTVMKDGAFIGSNSSLVAPLIIGAGATVGAGSTISKDIPDEQLGVARGRQRNTASWQRPVKQDAKKD